MRATLLAGLPILLLASCNAYDAGVASGNAAAQTSAGKPFAVQALAQFSEPWAMTFIPGTDQALVTERKGKLMLWREGAAAVAVAGVPDRRLWRPGRAGRRRAAPRFRQQ